MILLIVGASFLSIENIAALTWLDKPVVMTIRDMIPLTGGVTIFMVNNGSQIVQAVPDRFNTLTSKNIAAKKDLTILKISHLLFCPSIVVILFQVSVFINAG